jgi:hypothetical protein
VAFTTIVANPATTTLIKINQPSICDRESKPPSSTMTSSSRTVEPGRHV